MSVTRYDVNGPSSVFEDVNGSLVDYKDYAALEAKCAALAAELSAIEAIHNDAVFITDDQYEQCPPQVQKMIRSLAVLQIPAYQSFLAEVRASALPENIAEIIDSGDLETICWQHEHYKAEDYRLSLYRFRTDRAALLQGSQPVSNRDELPEEKGASLQLRNLIRQRHAEWSDKTFGNVGPVGPLKHLSKEALEAAAEPDDLSEWADMQFLLWDAQRRAGIYDGEITAAMEEKLRVNMARQWPEPKDGEPRLHIKEAGNSPVIPDGYVLVPIVPTEDMIINGFESEPDPHFSDEKEWEEYKSLSGCRQAARRAELCWAAMIKASQKLRE